MEKNVKKWQRWMLDSDAGRIAPEEARRLAGMEKEDELKWETEGEVEGGMVEASSSD